MDKKQVNISFLPTKNMSRFYITKDGRLLSFGVESDNIMYGNQHVYFTDDSEINGGDIVSHFDGVKRLIGKYIKPSVAPSYKYDDSNCIALSPRTMAVKVIASTDKELFRNYNIPLIPIKWIEEIYIPSNGSIKTVWIEMEYLDNGWDERVVENRLYKPKLSKDGQVVIAPKIEFTKEQKEEIASLIYRFAGFMQKHEDSTIKNWIEKNIN